jgi:protein required for attachment to host cells
LEHLKNQKEGSLIATQTKILEKMRHQGIVPNPQQPMQRTHETSHRVNKTGRRINIQNVVQTHSSRRPSQKLVQEIHQNIQGSLHWGPEWMCKENAHALVVPTTTTGGTSTTSTTTVASEPRHLVYANVYQDRHNYSKHPFVGIPCTRQTT